MDPNKEVNLDECEKPVDPDNYDEDLKDDPACGYGDDA